MDAERCPPVPGRRLKPAPGFEPGTPSLRVKCSGQLSYAGAPFSLFVSQPPPGSACRERSGGLDQPVADAAHGEHELRILGVALDLLPQVGDVDVAGADVAAEL